MSSTVRNTFERVCAAARYYTPIGVLLKHDIDGLLKRTAHIHSLTPQEVAEQVGIDWEPPKLSWRVK